MHVTNATYDRVEYEYNRLGETVRTKDQNETVHEYLFDLLGRQTTDKVTAFGTNIDQTVHRISRTYEVRGMVASITSHDDPDVGEGNVLDEVLREYNDFGQLAKEYQEHSGPKDGSTLYVQYNYAGADAGLRLESVRYPNGRLVHYTYGTTGSAADNLNRLDAIKEDSGGSPGDTLAGYTYLGLGTVVREDYEEPDVRLDLWGGTTGTYQGFDQFGRAVDQLWRDYGSSADVDRFLYGYDEVGNRLWKENEVAEANGAHLDELYDYDELYRLIAAERGNLNGTKDGMVGDSKNFAQDWGLDATGNWDNYRQDDTGDGNWDLDEQREHDNANEIIKIEESPDHVDHDAVGNMTKVPKPSDNTEHYDLTYDAWNRLVEVSDGGVLVAKFRYDGEGRRIIKLFDSDSPGDPDGLDAYEHLFLSGQQVIETRAGSGATPAQAEGIQPKYQNIWSPRYVDSLILRDENTDQDGLCDDSRVYYLADANYNVTALVDTAGNVLERYVYSPYGEVTIYDDDWSNTRSVSSYENITLYTGREFDWATRLYYYRARYYDAGLGRFVNRDPIGHEGGINLYGYVDNNPVIRLDPNGTRVCTASVPSVIIPGPIYTMAFAGGLGTGVGTNPSPVGFQPVNTLQCIQRRVLSVEYTCTDTIKTTTFWCGLWWSSSKKVTYTTYISQHQDRSYTVNIAPTFLYTTGVEASIPGLKGPGPVIKYYQLAPNDQARGNQLCAARAPVWPAYTPPPIV